jgi:hypothetical protein
MKTNMKTVTRSSLIVLALALAAPIPRCAAGQAEVSHLKGNSMSVAFSATNECYELDGYLFFVEELTKDSPPSAPAQFNQCGIAYTILDTCTGWLVSNVEGFAPPQSDTVSTNLSSAQMTQQVQGFDFIYGQSANIQMNLSWTASSGDAVTQVKTRLKQNGLTLVGNFSGRIRDAVVNGTLLSSGSFPVSLTFSNCVVSGTVSNQPVTSTADDCIAQIASLLDSTITITRP